MPSLDVLRDVARRRWAAESDEAVRTLREFQELETRIFACDDDEMSRHAAVSDYHYDQDEEEEGAEDQEEEDEEEYVDGGDGDDCIDAEVSLPGRGAVNGHVDAATQTEDVIVESTELARLRKEERVWRAREKDLCGKLTALSLKSEAATPRDDLEATIESLQGEVRRLRREKALLEKNRRAAEVLPTKRERKELELLSMKNAELLEQQRKMEQRSALAVDRLNNRIVELGKRNNELVEEVKVLESERAAFMMFSQTDATPRSSAQKGTPVDATPRNKSHAVKPFVKTEHKQLSPPTVTPENDDSALVATARKDLESLAGKLQIRSPIVEEGLQRNDKFLRVYADGTSLCWYRNRTIKRTDAATKEEIVYFKNGDYKQFLSSGEVVYWYASAKILHRTLVDGVQILLFDNGQTEKHYPDGTSEIRFPDQTVKYVFSDGREESVFADGTIQRINEDGARFVELPDGCKEVYWKNHKKKILPDGTTKIIYPDGRSETRYADGRLRFKDAQGRIVESTVGETVCRREVA